MFEIEVDLKKRHLTREEREALHNPQSDYILTSKGEVLRNACTLDVRDILEKRGIIKKKQQIESVV